MAQEKNIIIVGKTGVGKSALGNNFLGRKTFKSIMSANAVTEKSIFESGTVTEMKYNVVDTPGLHEAGSNFVKRALEIQNAFKLCPKPDAFLLVFKADRLFDDDIYTIDSMRVMFGDKVYDRTIVVFTHGDSLAPDESDDTASEKEFKAFWTKCDTYAKLISLCGNRVVRVENRKPNVPFVRNPIHKMLGEMAVDKYDFQDFSKHKDVLETYAKVCRRDEPVKDHLQRLNTLLTEKLKERWFLFIIGEYLVREVSFTVGHTVGSLHCLCVATANSVAYVADNWLGGSFAEGFAFGSVMFVAGQTILVPTLINGVPATLHPVWKRLG